MQKSGFWEHMDVLRAMLIRVCAAWMAVCIGLFFVMPWLFDRVVMAPCADDFVTYRAMRALAGLWTGSASVAEPFRLELINIRLTAPLMIHLTTALLMAAVVCAPYAVYELWRFVSPGLYVAERQSVRRALAWGTALFYGGLLVGYWLIFPVTLRFLAAYTLGGGIVSHISIDSYVETFSLLIGCMGLAFELPVVLWLLSLLGVLTRRVLRRYRRHAVVAIVVLAAVITPTGDPFTLFIVAIPLYLLYELGILLMKK